jgi:vancomycin resistance protein YoaR
LGVAFGLGSALLPRPEVIAAGVTVNHVNLGGMTSAQASKALRDAFAGVTEHSLTLTAGEHTRRVRLHELGIVPDVATTLRDALAVGHHGTLAARICAAARARWSGVTLATAFSANVKRAHAVLTAFGRAIDIPPVDAGAHWNGTRVLITPEQVGAKLNVPAAVKLVQQTLYTAVRTDRPLPATLALPYQEKSPRVSGEDLQQVDTLLGTCSTGYGSSSRNRVQNILMAAEAIDGTVLLPDETFSFNDTVGPRSAAGGYREAPVIVNGQLDTGIGGGICQVSTTLYNAVLLADLKIVTRNHHSLPSHYVAAGLDATVSYGSLDFRFRNNTETPIVIATAPHGRRLTVSILGTGPKPDVHLLRSNISRFPGRIITQQDPTLPAGKKVVDHKGTSGLAVTVTRVVGSGPAAKRQILSHDRYPGEPTIIRVGSGPAESAPDAPAAPAPSAPPTGAMQ